MRGTAGRTRIFFSEQSLDFDSLSPRSAVRVNRVYYVLRDNFVEYERE